MYSEKKIKHYRYDTINKKEREGRCVIAAVI